MIGHAALPERFAARVLATLGTDRRWRAQVMHCDNPAEAGRVRAAIGPDIRTVVRLERVVPGTDSCAMCVQCP